VRARTKLLPLAFASMNSPLHTVLLFDSLFVGSQALTDGIGNLHMQLVAVINVSFIHRKSQHILLSNQSKDMSCTLPMWPMWHCPRRTSATTVTKSALSKCHVIHGSVKTTPGSGNTLNTQTII